MKIITFADGFSSATPPIIEDDATKANVNLSNLASTAVNVDIVPVDTSKNLGSLLKKWATLYINTVELLGSIVISGSHIQKNSFSYSTEPEVGEPSGNIFIGSGNVSPGSNYGSGDVYLYTGAPDGIGVQGIISLGGRYVTVNSSQIKDVSNPTDAQDVVTLSYANSNFTQMKLDTYSNLVTWAATATDSALAFSTDTKILYYVVTGVLQEIDVMRTISGTITTAQITVGLTAVRATVSGSAPSATRKRLIITPSNIAGNIYLGGSGVTSSTGRLIVGPDTIVLDWDASDYYLISDTAGNTVSILEVV